MSMSITQFVSKYVNENGRGCPKGVLIHVGGFKAKDIAAMLDNGTLESGRGSEGGIFVAGTKPVPKERLSVSLKSRMADYLRTLSDAQAIALVAEYDSELQKRSDSQQ
jgi:hypothetical protein